MQHIAFYTRGNAGDTVLVSSVRAAFEHALGPIQWSSQHAHWRFDSSALKVANDSHLVVIGGGGLFLTDTHPNSRSGWQWNSSVDDVRKMKERVVVFAVGYNRFRGQQDFAPAFAEHLAVVADKAEFIGLRNFGSIEAVKEYLPTELQHKLRYQPCPTTLLAKLEPALVQQKSSDFVVGINLAYDRPHLRFGARLPEVLAEVGHALRALEADGARIEYLAQCPEDERLIPGLGSLATLDVKRLYGLPPREVAVAYGRPLVVIGMRGHSQMIPFGMGRPIVSLITHNKLRFFLDDIGRPQWGIEANAASLSERLLELVRNTLEQRSEIERDVRVLQEGLWKTTMDNILSLEDNAGRVA